MEKWKRRRSTTKCSRMSVFRCCVISSEGATKFPTIRSIFSKYSTQFPTCPPPPPVPERIVFPFQEILFIPGSVTNNCLTRIYRRTRGGLRLVCVFGYWQRTHSTPVERKAIDLFLEKRVKNFVNKKIYVFFFIFLFFFC